LSLDGTFRPNLSTNHDKQRQTSDTMSEPIEEDGYVWELGSNDRASARLRFDPKHGTKLTLINAPWALEFRQQWDALHGESLWGVPWSLFGVASPGPQQMPGLTANTRSECTAVKLITGIHAAHEDEIAFSDLALH
jgi:hypothetical protein